MKSLRQRRGRASVKKRPSHAARRYQPRLSLCSGQCFSSAVNQSEPLQHRNLILVGNVMSTSHRDKFRKCSISKRVNVTDPRKFETFLETELLYARNPIVQFIVYIRVQNWSDMSDSELLAEGVVTVIDKLSDKLGNVSIFASESNGDSKSAYSEPTAIQVVKTIVLEHCQIKKHNHCLKLNDLYSVLDQMQQLQSHPSVLDVYNTKFVKLGDNGSTAVLSVPTISPIVKILPVPKQLDKLLTLFCERERSNNRFIEIQHIQLQKNERPTAD
jgi:hypothetical protein